MESRTTSTLDIMVGALAHGGCVFRRRLTAGLSVAVGGVAQRAREDTAMGGMGWACTGASLGATGRLGVVHGKQEVARGRRRRVHAIHRATSGRGEEDAKVGGGLGRLGRCLGDK